MKFNEKINEKLNDKILYENLKKFASDYKVSKENAYKGLDFEKLQSDMNKLKDKEKDDVLELFEEFKENAINSGANVFRASNSYEACKYIAEVCKKHNTKYVVKSKSMTSEEIKLNDYLIEQNIEPIETDLGEWILQLACEHPSHMVLPAIHKTRGQVADLFSKYTGKPVDKDDIEAMVKIARKYLREYYFKAQVGITGANVAVSSAGAIATVTNEGNARLSNTVPPVHIVILGYEKLVKNFNDAMKIIRMLPKSATGQNITTYITWVKGQNPSFQAKDGKKEVHFVFLDNGRLAFLEHPVMKEALKCIRCGSCANVCPVYEMVGGHVFGHIYTGAIGLIMTALFHGSDNAKDILKLCIGCKACSNNCPAGIDLQEIIFDLKSSMVEKYGLNPLKKFIFSTVLTNSTIFSNSIKVGKLLQKSLVTEDKRYLKKVPVLPKSKDFRVLPAIAEKSFTESFKNIFNSNKSNNKKVFFYPGCAIEYFYPQMGIAMVKILEKAGYSVDIPNKAACCGLPAIASGDSKSAKKTIFNNLKFMGKPEKYDAYITLCPSCGMAIKEDFTKYVLNDPDKVKYVDSIKNKVMSFGEFLLSENIEIKIDTDMKVTYHVPCHQGRGMGFSAEEMLQSLLSDNFIKLEDADVCCGFGGSYSIDFANISSSILDKKIEKINSSQANIIITDCPGCVMQIDGGVKKQNLDVKVMHLSEFIDLYIKI